MSFWSRLTNLFRGDALNKGLAEELESHIEEAVERGRDPDEARRAFGSSLRHREECRDLKIIPWLDSLRADAIYGWRQVWKKKIASAVAILSLALAIGACTSAYRLIDALLLRPLPVSNPNRLYTLAREWIGFDGKLQTYDAWAHPAFRLMREAVRGKAELLAISYAERKELTYKSDQEMEKACVQYTSGWLFETFGLRPAIGRLLTERDDVTPGAHPYAVLSHDYWTRRFGQDPNVVGRTFRLDQVVYEIVGVVDKPFTGTEPGIVTDLFVPTMMHFAADFPNATPFRTLAQVNPGVAVEPLRAKLAATSQAFEEERLKSSQDETKETRERFLHQKLLLEPAAAGTSGLQKDYARSLAILAILVGLVLLIACANVTNLMMAGAAARSREMALRVSIGAGRKRLVQLVMTESAWLAALASATGAFLAWWAPPFVVSMINSQDNPVHLNLSADWHALGFILALAAIVTFMLGLLPAVQVSSVKPATALKGGQNPHLPRRMTHGLIFSQVAFCVLVLFVACLLLNTFERLSHRPTGFSPSGLLTIDTIANDPQPAGLWQQVADHLKGLPGVNDVAIAGWPLLGGDSSNGFISIGGATPSPVLAYFLSVSPGWRKVMNIRLVAGRDLRDSDSSPGSVLVNEAFAKQFFNGEDPIGRAFNRGGSQFQVVGLVADVPYRSLRETILPQVYAPFRAVQANAVPERIREANFIARTSQPNPLALASLLRHEVPAIRPEFRVSNIRTQSEINLSHTIRERLLARLALFFAVVAVLLAAVGIYGVLEYSVAQQQREIGIRLALGARAGSIAKGVTFGLFLMVILGAFAGMTLGLASARLLQTLLYAVKASDLSMLAPPLAILFAASVIAALRPVIRALRIDPVKMLRAE